MRAGLVLLGAGAVATAIMPTPDDLTVVSPAIQLIGGGLLIAVGLLLPEDARR